MTYITSNIWDKKISSILCSFSKWNPGRSVEWGLESQFCQPILLQTKCTGFNNEIILLVGKILFTLYENSD